jgi:hypothetical protein
VKDRYRWAAWKGTISISNGVISRFIGRGFENIEESCWSVHPQEIGFRSDTYGDSDSIEMDILDLARCTIKVEGTIGGYVKVGDPLKGNPFVHCPSFEWEIQGKQLIESQNGVLRLELGGAEMFIAFERMSDQAMPREVSGTIDLAPKNGPHGFRPVYFLGRQVDDAKAWTSALFVEFK